MTIGELERQKEYWLNIKAFHVDKKSEFISKKTTIYIPAKQALSAAIEKVQYLSTESSNALSAICDAIYIGEDSISSQKELKKHAQNMKIAANKFSDVAKYCDQQLKYLDDMISKEEFEISFAQEKINEYNSYLAEKIIDQVGVTNDVLNDSSVKNTVNKKNVLSSNITLYD